MVICHYYEIFTNLRFNYLKIMEMVKENILIKYQPKEVV